MREEPTDRGREKKGGETQWEMKREKKDTKLTYKGNKRQRVRDTEIQRGTGETAKGLRARGLPQRIGFHSQYLMVAYSCP